MPLVEQDVGHVVVAWIDDESLHLSVDSVGGRDRIALPHVDTSERLRSRMVTCGRDLGPLPPIVRPGKAEAVVGHRRQIAGTAAPDAACHGRERSLLGILQRLELCGSAPQPDLVGRQLGQPDRDQMSLAAAVLGFDDEMGERPATGSITIRRSSPRSPSRSPHETALPIVNVAS